MIFWLTTACQTSCGNSNQQPLPYVDGITHTTTNGTEQIYETTPYDGEWLDFQSYRRFRLIHKLETTNYSIDARIAFSSNPVPKDSDASSDVAFASGDVVVVEQINADSLQVRNDTCSQQYLYVRLTAAIGVGDAGVN